MIGVTLPEVRPLFVCATGEIRTGDSNDDLYLFRDDDNGDDDGGDDGNDDGSDT